jgi:hypothetical protein
MAEKQTPKTSMVIKEVIEHESGGIVINIRARRGNKHYRFVYQIAQPKMHEIDLEMLKLRVKTDIDAKESEDNQKSIILEKLGLQVDHRIPLD